MAVSSRTESLEAEVRAGKVLPRHVAIIMDGNGRWAHERGLPPPQDTPLGGHIGLHGEGEAHAGDSARVDWTYGCVAVTDAEIERIAERVAVGTPVWIHP